jgi:two-component system, chemotaxis family, sensor kinase Cph1
MTSSSTPEIIITSENVDLTNCAREQIHIPNSIQPHGVVLVIEKNSFKIIQASENIEVVLGYKYLDVIDAPLKSILSSGNIKQIKDCLAQDFSAINPIKIKIGKETLNLIVHENQNFIFLEFEPTDKKYKNDFISFYNMTKKVVDQMQMSAGLQELSEIIVHSIRELSGFDRVMVYRFEDDDSGFVLAESKIDELESFCGLRYPATDVPQPARRLYLLNNIRLIADVDYQAVALPNHPQTNQPFDLSYTNLRSVSPLHIEYLKNMGVKASMSISLIHENKLWGLIACHHCQPRYLPYEMRSACEFLGKVMSLNIAIKEENENLEYRVQLKENLSELFSNLSLKADINFELNRNIDLLKSIVKADGLAICLNDQITVSGITPTISQIQNLSDWLRKHQDQDFFQTSCLPAVYAKAESFQSLASGLIILYLNKVDNSYIIWFRPEVAQTVAWAGNPNKDLTMEEDGTITLSPRKSFDLWQQTVTGQSLAWLQCEIQQIIEFRSILVDMIIHKKSSELVDLNLELQKSNEDLDSFAYIASHDLKEPLRGIYNYAYVLIEDYEQSLDSEGSRKLKTLMTLTKRMEKLIDGLLHYSRLGSQELDLEPVDVNSIIAKDIKIILEVSQEDAIDIRVPKKIPLFNADKTLVEEVFMNLITNGIKYNDKPDKWVEVGYVIDPKKSTQPIYYVRDNGIGIEDEHQEIIFRIFKRLHGQKEFGGGTGAGLTIVKKIIDRHDGKIWIESVYGEGTTFLFTLAGEEK